MSSYYRAALYLCAAIALTDAIWILRFVLPRTPAYAEAFIIALIATVITALGLLLRSNLIRYFGGVFTAIWAAALLWGLFSAGAQSLLRPTGVVISLYYVVVAALNLLTVFILLWSKQFAYEFAKLRESEPKYIVHLRRLLIGAIIAAALFATFNDIVKLASAP
jgi:hypothetical protein